MKNKLNLLVWALGLLIVSSCGVPDPEKVAEEYIEIEKEIEAKNSFVKS